MIRRSTSTLTLLALLGAFTPGLGCLVSFDGYKPLGDTTDGGDGGSLGGSSSAGKGGESAGRGGGGKAGTSGGRGGSGNSGGKSGSANSGGSANPTGGGGGTAANGGEGNEGGEAGAAATGGSETGGSSGQANGGAGGNAGTTGGASGAAGTAAGNGGSSGQGGSAGLGGSGGVDSCPVGMPGPALVEVPAPGGGFFCIDRTEVTNLQYAAFLAAAPGTSGQSETCTWNDSYLPEESPECDPVPYDPSARPNNPVSCVDWCDARAYCAWAGKELCGSIDGGENSTADFDDATKSAWYRGCSAGGTKALPYGNEYDGSACVGLDYGVVRAVNVATVAPCQGGYDGLWDMSGNVSEWEDSCDGSGGPTGRCAHRGGSWVTPGEAALYCNSSLPSDNTPNPILVRRDAHDEHIGVRCCYRP